MNKSISINKGNFLLYDKKYGPSNQLKVKDEANYSTKSYEFFSKLEKNGSKYSSLFEGAKIKHSGLFEGVNPEVEIKSLFNIDDLWNKLPPDEDFTFTMPANFTEFNSLFTTPPFNPKNIEEFRQLIKDRLIRRQGLSNIPSSVPVFLKPQNVSPPVESQLIPLSEEEHDAISLKVMNLKINFEELEDRKCIITQYPPLNPIYRKVPIGKSDGSTIRQYYDRRFLEEWLSYNNTCPMTREPININDFTEDPGLQLKILQKYSEHGGILPLTVKKKLNQQCYLKFLDPILKEYDKNKGFGRKFLPFYKKYAPAITELRSYLSSVEKDQGSILSDKILEIVNKYDNPNSNRASQMAIRAIQAIFNKSKS